MRKKPGADPVSGQPVHPHIKLTREKLPRALATRVLRELGDEYFGAFLTRTSVRILIDFLSRTFRLRSCTIDIDGGFDVPCTQFYEKRCVAPCVASLCDRESYIRIVDLVRLFLRNDRELFLASISNAIEQAAETLDFERAAFFRDMLTGVEKMWANSRWQIWLDDTVDSYEIEEEDEDSIVVIVVTQRGRRTLGELVFAFPKRDETRDENAVKDLIEHLYRYYNPREIRVPYDFSGRKALANELRTKIVVTTPLRPRVTAERALEVTKARLRLERAKRKETVDQTLRDLQSRFGLSFVPNRIEAYDVAHISGTGFAAAASVFANGEFRPNDYRHFLSSETSELNTLRDFVGQRLAAWSSKRGLILIDGGRSQLNAAIAAAKEFSSRPPIVAVVKPRGKHSSISHFLTEDGRRIEFDVGVAAFRLVQRLRDDAHDLANATHRLSRDMMHRYELSSILPSLNERERQELLRDMKSIKKIVEADAEYFVKRYGEARANAILKDLEAHREGHSKSARPLIVPISYVEPDGQADDLIPIASRIS